MCRFVVNISQLKHAIKYISNSPIATSWYVAVGIYRKSNTETILERNFHVDGIYRQVFELFIGKFIIKIPL